MFLSNQKVITVCLLIAFTFGCGQKGALYHPEPAKENNPEQIKKNLEHLKDAAQQEKKSSATTKQNKDN